MTNTPLCLPIIFSFWHGSRSLCSTQSGISKLNPKSSFTCGFSSRIGTRLLTDLLLGDGPIMRSAYCVIFGKKLLPISISPAPSLNRSGTSSGARMPGWFRLLPPARLLRLGGRGLFHCHELRTQPGRSPLLSTFLGTYGRNGMGAFQRKKGLPKTVATLAREETRVFWQNLKELYVELCVYIWSSVTLFIVHVL